MKKQQCSNCIFSSWYHNFKNVTFESKIIPLSSEFIYYLNCDGIILPDCSDVKYSNELEGYSDNEETWTHDSGDNCDLPNFPDLKRTVDDVIKQFGGAVFPKLNWSCPKDAIWISHDGTLKCATFNDVCLFLKSSDFITHDLSKPYEYCEGDSITHPNDQYELVLREWRNILPGMEFRCFVKENKLVGISQRHYNSFFGYLLADLERYSQEIIEFYNAKIKGKFADSSYVFDIYRDQNQYYLVDFNPFGEITDSLLFSWEELHNMDVTNASASSNDLFRVITSSEGIQPGPLVGYAMPKDILDLKSGEDINKMIDFLNLKDLISKPAEDDEEEGSGS